MLLINREANCLYFFQYSSSLCQERAGLEHILGHFQAGLGNFESEQGNIPLLSHVGRTVHGHDFIVQRQQIIQQGKNGFLDLSSVGSVAYDGHLLGEIEYDKSLRGGLINLRGSFKSGGANNAELWHMPAVFLGSLWLDEHISGEQAVPGIFGNDPDWQTIVRVSPAITILNKNILKKIYGLFRTARRFFPLFFLFRFLYRYDLSTLIEAAARANYVWQDHGPTIRAGHQVGSFQCIMGPPAVSAAFREFTFWLGRHYYSF